MSVIGVSRGFNWITDKTLPRGFPKQRSNHCHQKVTRIPKSLSIQTTLRVTVENNQRSKGRPRVWSGCLPGRSRASCPGWLDGPFAGLAVI